MTHVWQVAKPLSLHHSGSLSLHDLLPSQKVPCLLVFHAISSKLCISDSQKFSQIYDCCQIFERIRCKRSRCTCTCSLSQFFLFIYLLYFLKLGLTSKVNDFFNMSCQQYRVTCTKIFIKEPFRQGRIVWSCYMNNSYFCSKIGSMKPKNVTNKSELVESSTCVRNYL